MAKVRREEGPSLLDWRKTFVYGLRHPVTKDVRYVGKADAPETRLYRHNWDARSKPKYRLHAWIKSLLAEGMAPEMFLIEECSLIEWDDREQHWISHCRSLGCDLVNHTDGGEGMCNPTAETRAKMSASQKGKIQEGHPQTPETRAKISAKQKGREQKWPLTPEGLERVREAQRNREVSDETRARMAEGRRGMHHSEETRAKIAEASLKRPPRPKSPQPEKQYQRPEEWRRKIGEANRKRVLSDETKQKISAGNSGKKMSDEARRKMSRSFLVTPPGGEETLAYNLTEFCAANGLNRASAYHVLKGIIPDIHGWKFRPASD